MTQLFQNSQLDHKGSLQSRDDKKGKDCAVEFEGFIRNSNS